MSSRLEVGSRPLLARILDEPALVAEVRALPARALAKLIDHVGLEDAGEIVQLATTEQLAAVFDEDLWTSREPGEDEVFDADRFVGWLEILLEATDAVAARRLAELEPDVLTLAFHRLVVVIDIESLAAEIAEGMHEDGDAIEQALDGALSHEIGPYLVVARRHDGWDAILQALVALDEVDHEGCDRLLERCAAMTTRQAEEKGGLHEVLGAEESLADDVAGARADRRAREGFVAPSDARAFLRLACSSTLEEIAASPRDPVTRAWFREVERTPAAPVKATKLLGLLESAGVLERKKKASAARTKALPGPTPTPSLGTALGALLARDPRVHAERMEELAFLVNVLVSGEGRRPGDAAEAVVRIAARGLAHLSRTTSRTIEDLVAEGGVVVAFRTGLRLEK